MTRSLVGQVFGRLTVIAYAGRLPRRTGGYRYLWKCRCCCKDQNITIVRTELLTQTTNCTRSCGCLRRELGRERAVMARRAYSEQARQRRLAAS